MTDDGGIDESVTSEPTDAVLNVNDAPTGSVTISGQLTLRPWGITAELGSMAVTEQIDALKTLSANPFRYLYAPRFLAAALTLPLLVLIADIIGVMGGWLVSVYALDFDSTTYIRNTMDFLTIEDVAVGLIKAVIFGMVIALMGCYQGSKSSAGATGVGRAATLSMVGAAVLVLAANYILSTFFVQIGI